MTKRPRSVRPGSPQHQRKSELNLEALKATIAAEQADAADRPGPGGRPRTGTKSFVRDHLDPILQARADSGATWTQMVTALSRDHDLRQGDGNPISGRRLSALVSACLNERARQAAVASTRAQRADLIQPRSSTASQQKPETAAGPPHLPADAVPSTAADASPLSEDDIRNARQQRHQHLFKRS